MIIYKVYIQFFKSIIYFILLFILKIIYPLIKIRFQEIETKNIGHYSKSIEIFLCEEELKIYKLLVIAWPSKPLSKPEHLPV